MRVALLGDLRRIPWLPLNTGILRGFRALGHDARGFQCGEYSELYAEELRDFAPELTLVSVYRDDVVRLLPLLELARQSGAAVELAFDDPYDHATSLQVAGHCDGVFTPEREALPSYAAAGVRAWHVHPWSDPVMHAPVPAEKTVDVAWIGCRDFPPRNRTLLSIETWLRERGRVYGEACGKNRWLAGRALSAVLGTCRVLLDIPRFEMARLTNWGLIPCTYTAPRVHLAAASGAFVLAIGARADLAECYPSIPSCELGQQLELLETWLLEASDEDRAEVAAENRERFLARFTAEHAAGLMLDTLAVAQLIPWEIAVRRAGVRGP